MTPYTVRVIYSQPQLFRFGRSSAADSGLKAALFPRYLGFPGKIVLSSIIDSSAVHSNAVVLKTIINQPSNDSLTSLNRGLSLHFISCNRRTRPERSNACNVSIRDEC